MRQIMPFIAATLLAASCSPQAAAPPDPAPAHAAGVQLFQYPWPSVARQCKDTLGPNGIGFVLLSPAQEHIAGPQWWTSYQPVSYRIESKLGTREEFRQMVQDCHDAGVRVVADAVINHMAGIDSGTGVAGSSFEHYSYPGIYTSEDFHHCGLTPNDDIAIYSDQAQLQNCELVNLADLDTSRPNVRETIVGFLNDLRSLGVDGFRIDAAKHMSADDVAAIVGAVEGEPLIISEVIRAHNEPVQPEDYLGFGGVFAFGWSKDLAGVLRGGSLAPAFQLRDGAVPSDKAYTFVANHDTERADRHLNPRDEDLFRLAELTMLAGDYGTPVLYSGYAFDDRDAGPRQDNGRVLDVVCPEQQFRCLTPEVLGMAKWRSLVGAEPIQNVTWNSPVLTLDRGGKGFLALSIADEPRPFEASTALPDGEYCNLAAPDQCGFVVSGGRISGSVPPKSAVALHSER
ncbi:alpha-amylase family protein [Tessaracoccus sp. OH4464_COT-324]|uniref:alpha-amylase n=1 Tax=Tessaracoccus sp. OH4464_COT-324 TaxID=2491059 RepID=UPI001319EE57|nr:alpha-amylase family protein [Tessaracoccus sp. OH4464_COT-324]